MKQSVASRLKRKLRNTWLHPRYISTRYMRAALVQAASYAHGSLLDAGCGASPYRDLFDGRTNQYVRVDWPTEVYEARPDVFADAQRLPFRDGSVDTILATELIEHLPRPQEFLREARRLLRTGGTLIISAPFLEPLHEEPRDYRRFTSFGLEGIVEEHGFVVERTWKRGGFWSVVIGSFFSQAVFELINPASKSGRRNVVSAVLAPFLSIPQWIGWAFDQVASGKRYALGYVVAASRGSDLDDPRAASRS
jgi:SAM-dependent methyltransferase